MQLIILLSFTLLMVCSLMAELEGSFCASKFEGGKLLSEGNCENHGSSAVLHDLDAKVKAREANKKEMKTTETTTPPSTGTDTTASSVAPYFNTSQCEFIVSGICYWSYVNFNSANFIDFTEAQAICADKGSVPAYLPTELAYNKTAESVRAKIIAGRKKWAHVYTGVMFDYQTFKVTYPDTAVYMKWSPGYPFSYNDWTSVLLIIRSNYDDINQGMFNSSPSGRVIGGVVCQNNLN